MPEIISQGCWVTSIQSNGHSAGQNYGLVAGLPTEVGPGIDFSGMVKNLIHPILGKQLTIVQSVSVFGTTKPLPPEIGEPREIKVSTPTTLMQGIGQAPGSDFPRLEIKGHSTTVKLRKNVVVKAVLNTVRFEVDPTVKNAGAILACERLKLSNLPTVDGAKPRTWDYTFDVHVGGGIAVLTIRQMSVALRAMNCVQGLDVLSPTEELVMVAPWESLILHATPHEPKAFGQIEATFLLRDFPELHVA
jgi:hypothetical protein